MAYIITEPCIDVKDGDCTLACPVDCIYEGGRMFYIQPDECINCGLCLSICPVDAIVYDMELTDEMRPFEKINREFFEEVTGWGMPGGWDAAHTTSTDHPRVAAHPRQPATADVG
ncbi:ferredoxin [Oricola cellulosilytica]|uniref:Ferredoxin n=1 Tax=Oricola cellulosilytica TaxID=1429082 RepID=A0A4R0PD29_9HYPH|nr:ferredoxin [Oricola cellulosilytica]TCD15390.1 ferredoxin [Oricola cellulosilytica]